MKIRLNHDGTNLCPIKVEIDGEFNCFMSVALCDLIFSGRAMGSEFDWPPAPEPCGICQREYQQGYREGLETIAKNTNFDLAAYRRELVLAFARGVDVVGPVRTVMLGLWCVRAADAAIRAMEAADETR